MDEQSRPDLPRVGRTPARSTARRRPPEATFTAPPAPMTDHEPPAVPAPKPTPHKPKVVPVVLFQPPTVEDSPVSRQSVPPAAEEKLTVLTTSEPTTVASGDGPTEPGPEAQETKTSRKAAPKKSTPRKAAPRKTTKTAEVTNVTTDGTAANGAAPPATSRTKRASSTTTGKRSRTAGQEQLAVTARLLDHPGYAPELLALAAVDALGPGARRWARKLRATYPTAPPAGLARLATRRFARFAAAGRVISLGAGIFTPVASLAVRAWAQAGLVLHLAAAYDLDPTHPDRAVDLLVMTGVHSDDKAARVALATVQAALPVEEKPIYQLAEAAGRLATPLVVQTGSWLSLRMASRLLPGTALLGAIVGSSSDIQRLAARAIARYRDAKTG